jgi:hypothetical protein
MKKIGVLILFLIFLNLFSISIIYADSLSDTTNSLEEKMNKVEEFSEEDNKWEYLSKQWSGILLKNSFVSYINSILVKFNFLFKFLFNEDYSISLALGMAIIFFFFFFNNLHVIFKGYSTFNSNISLVISFAFSVIAAQIGVYKKLYETFFKLVFYSEGVWGWIWFIFIMACLVLIGIFNKKFARVNILRKERAEKAKEKLNREILDKSVKNIQIINEDLRFDR